LNDPWVAADALAVVTTFPPCVTTAAEVCAREAVATSGLAVVEVFLNPVRPVACDENVGVVAAVPAPCTPKKCARSVALADGGVWGPVDT
jgi:hypothetical protein